ncbi:cation channel sperm-associated protein 3 [Lepisosteus oculatus]|uniref:Cation channel sperm associated 3 n=1 Tax=Lepisosteus oculatus TaxID=7918 RepID=W5MVM1_LEPOC|nr:PREDICTED: cation channel sperm-associated protein 3 [Lepisosteus oculatus]
MENDAKIKGRKSSEFLIDGAVSQIALRRFSDWNTSGTGLASSKKVRKDIEFYDYISNITQKSLFNGIIMSTILINALFMALETDYDLKYKLYGFFEIVDELFLAIYTMEFLMKVYVEPKGYWKSAYNVFDAFILTVSFIPLFISGTGMRSLSSLRMLRAARSLRVLKTVSFIRGLQALISALFKTLKSVVYVLVLLFLLMFIFAIIGYYFFGDPVTGDPQNWGDLGAALFTLFSLVTVDGWTDLQKRLDDLGFTSSRAFTIVFILLGYFIFFNMFIGVVIMEIHHSTKSFEKEVQSEREASLTQKKQAILQRQQEEVRQLIQSHTSNDHKDFSMLVEQFKKSLRRTDYMVMEDLCTSMSFIDIYLASLDHQDNTLNRLQQLYFETAFVLSQIVEEDLRQAKGEKKAKILEDK